MFGNSISVKCLDAEISSLSVYGLTKFLNADVSWLSGSGLMLFMDYICGRRNVLLFGYPDKRCLRYLDDQFQSSSVLRKNIRITSSIL